MSFAHPATFTSLLIGGSLTLLDLFMYSMHRMNEALAVLSEEIAESKQKLAALIRRAEQERASCAEPLFLALTTKAPVPSSTRPLLRTTYGDLGYN